MWDGSLMYGLVKYSYIKLMFEFICWCLVLISEWQYCYLVFSAPGTWCIYNLKINALLLTLSCRRRKLSWKQLLWMKQKNEIHVVDKVEDLVVGSYPPNPFIWSQRFVQFFCIPSVLKILKIWYNMFSVAFDHWVIGLSTLLGAYI